MLSHFINIHFILEILSYQVISGMTQCSMTLTQLYFFKSIFSMNKVEIGWALRKSFVLFGADWSSEGQRWGSGGRQHQRRSSPLLCLSSVYPVQLAQLLHKRSTDLHGDLRLKKHLGLEQFGFFIYAGGLRFFKRLAECYFRPILDILW